MLPRTPYIKPTFKLILESALRKLLILGGANFLGAMREARIKVPADSGDAVYHCITRVVNGERLLDEPAREVLRKGSVQGQAKNGGP